MEVSDPTGTKILVFGSGGVGGYFGGRLAAAGCRVGFIARGAHLSALRDQGLRIESAQGDLHLAPIEADENPAAFGTPDFVLFCVKLYDVEEAGRLLAPVLGPHSLVISLQNGVDARARLAAIVGTAAVGGVAHISARIGQPGVIDHNGTLARFFFGPSFPDQETRLKALATLCAQAHVAGRMVEDIETLIWEKFVFLAAFSGVTALTRLPIGSIRDDAASRALFVGAMQEASDVAAAQGITFSQDPVEAWLARIPDLPASYRASMAEDLAQGKCLELSHLSGAVVRLGQASGTPTPIHDVILRALSPYAEGAPQPV